MSKEYNLWNRYYHWTKIVQSGIIKVGSIIEFPENTSQKMKLLFNTGKKTTSGAPKIGLVVIYALFI